LRYDLLEPANELFEILNRKLRVRLDTPLALHILDGVLEEMPRRLQHDLAERLDEAPVRVPGEAFVSRALRQATDGSVVQAKIKDGVHHPRHGDRRAAPYGDQQRVLRVPEPPYRGLLHTLEALLHLVHQALGHLSGLYVEDANLHSSDEAYRNRETETVHSNEPEPLPPYRAKTSAEPSSSENP
jgi:hypothetical protein